MHGYIYLLSSQLQAVLYFWEINSELFQHPWIWLCYFWFLFLLESRKLWTSLSCWQSTDTADKCFIHEHVTRPTFWKGRSKISSKHGNLFQYLVLFYAWADLKEILAMHFDSIRVAPFSWIFVSWGRQLFTEWESLTL